MVTQTNLHGPFSKFSCLSKTTLSTEVPRIFSKSCIVFCYNKLSDDFYPEKINFPLHMHHLNSNQYIGKILRTSLAVLIFNLKNFVFYSRLDIAGLHNE